MTAVAMGNPADLRPEQAFQAIGCLTNHFEIRNFNTLLAGCALKKNMSALSLSVRHSPLPEIPYTRTMGSLNLSLAASAHFTVGVALRISRIRLPDSRGSTWNCGGIAGVKVQTSKKVSCGIAGGYYHVFPALNQKKADIVQLMADIGYHISKNTRIGLDAEMITGIKPALTASVACEIMTGIRLTAGAGSGHALFFAGISFDFNRFSTGAVSCFNPSIGRTHSLALTAKSRK